MTKKKIFLIALAFLIFLPIYVYVIQPTYNRYQVSAQAEVYFNEIPKYPGATPVEKDLSFYTTGYGYRYKTNDDPDKVINYFLENLSGKWALDSRPDTSNARSVILSHTEDNYKLNVSVRKLNNQPLTSPPYDLSIYVYKP